MPFLARQEAFTCAQCGKHVEELVNGSYRNHCPSCLWSKHVDHEGPGDRASLCLGLMEPRGLHYRGNKGWMIDHVCTVCGKNIPNIIAPDDDIIGFSTLNPQSL